jgi:hypothetical protein
MSGSDEETKDPLIADNRAFYKVEKWTKDGAKVDHMLYSGSNLDKAREVFTEAIRHRPRVYGLQSGSGAKCWSGGRRHLDRPRHTT